MLFRFRLWALTVAVALFAVANVGNAQGVTTNNFDTTGTPYTLQLAGGGSAPFINAGGPSGSYLRLLNDEGGQNNRIAFDATATSYAGKTVVADFDFRVTNGPGAGMADGFSMLLLPTSTNGTTGNGVNYPGAAEEPNVAGTIAIGFDLYPGENDASLHYNGAELFNSDVNPVNLDLDSGVFHHAKLVLEDTGNTVTGTLFLTPNSLGVPGTPVTAFSNVVLPGVTDIYAFRVAFNGRTGGETMFLDIDNVNVFATPEPTGIALWSLLALGLVGYGGYYFRRR